MRIYIHTYGRADKQTTWDQLPPSIRRRTQFVVQAREAHLYKDKDRFPNVLVLPKGITKLSPTRQYLLELKHRDKLVCLLDDDLTFAVRKDASSVKLSKAYGIEIENMFYELENTLKSGYVHCGISAREGNNRIETDSVECTRMMRVLAYNAHIVNKYGCRFDRIPTKQDFDMTLQLLRLGEPNVVYYTWAHNQAGSNVKGGCATYRDDKMMETSAHKLAKLHPGFVKVVQKKTKTAWGGGTRTDVQIAWKKAFASAK